MGYSRTREIQGCHTKLLQRSSRSSHGLRHHQVRAAELWGCLVSTACSVPLAHRLCMSSILLCDACHTLSKYPSVSRASDETQGMMWEAFLGTSHCCWTWGVCISGCARLCWSCFIKELALSLESALQPWMLLLWRNCPPWASACPWGSCPAAWHCTGAALPSSRGDT